jgi:hypothetical protein
MREYVRAFAQIHKYSRRIEGRCQSTLSVGLPELISDNEHATVPSLGATESSCLLGPTLLESQIESQIVCHEPAFHSAVRDPSS